MISEYNRKLLIAVDFDGTIVEHKYPDIGKILPGAFETMKDLQKKEHKLILWTVRDGIELDEAVEFCAKHGIVFYAVNNSYPDEKYEKYMSRKILVDVFIDDRNVGGFLGWEKIRELML